MRIRVRPLERERPALVWLHLVDATAVIVRQIYTSTIGMAFEHQRLAVRRNLGLVGDEVVLTHAEIRRDSCDLTIRHTDDPVLDPATCPTTLTFKFHILSPLPQIISYFVLNLAVEFLPPPPRPSAISPRSTALQLNHSSQTLTHSPTLSSTIHTRPSSTLTNPTLQQAENPPRVRREHADNPSSPLHTHGTAKCTNSSVRN